MFFIKHVVQARCTRLDLQLEDLAFKREKNHVSLVCVNEYFS